MWGYREKIDSMKVDTFEKIGPIESQYIRVELRRLHTAVTQKLAYKFQRPSVQREMHCKTVPKDVTTNLERWFSLNLLNQPVGIRTDRSASDWKESLVLPKLSNPQVAPDLVLEVAIKDRDKAFGWALETALIRPPYPPISPKLAHRSRNMQVQSYEPHAAKFFLNLFDPAIESHQTTV
jgi:hypothetical protein